MADAYEVTEFLRGSKRAHADLDVDVTEISIYFITQQTNCTPVSRVPITDEVYRELGVAKTMEKYHTIRAEPCVCVRERELPRGYLLYPYCRGHGGNVVVDGDVDDVVDEVIVESRVVVLGVVVGVVVDVAGVVEVDVVGVVVDVVDVVVVLTVVDVVVVDSVVVDVVVGGSGHGTLINSVNLQNKPPTSHRY